MSESQPRLQIVPLSLAAANEFVAQYHRHHEPVIGHKFSIGVVDDERTLRRPRGHRDTGHEFAGAIGGRHVHIVWGEPTEGRDMTTAKEAE